VVGLHGVPLREAPRRPDPRVRPAQQPSLQFRNPTSHRESDRPRRANAPTFRLDGESDLSNARDVESVAKDLIDEGIGAICLDLRVVSFRDSSIRNLSFS
jgi:hypothetical protein